MPNRCFNSIGIEGSATEVAKIKKYIKKNSFIQNFYPCPKELEKPKTEFKDDVEKEKYLTNLKKKYGATDWYDRRINHRGCKRDVNPYINEYRYQYISLSFDSPRGPPLGALEKLSAKHPEVDITIRYEEGGMGFSGEACYRNGEESYHTQYDDAYYGEGVRCIICGSMYENDSEQWSDDTERICEDCYSRLNNHKLHCDICGAAHIITKEEVKNGDYYVCDTCRETNPNLPKNTYTDLQIADHRC